MYKFIGFVILILFGFGCSPTALDRDWEARIALDKEIRVHCYKISSTRELHQQCIDQSWYKVKRCQGLLPYPDILIEKCAKEAFKEE